MSIAHRKRDVEELMDGPGVDPAALRRALRFIRRVNTLLRYNAAVVGQFERWSHGWHPGERVRVLDVATGTADLPQALDRWSSRRGRAVESVGLDLHPTTLAVAAEWSPETPLVRGDALRLPFADRSFDYATCGMFLHHLDEEVAVGVLREMERVTRRGWIASDLLRRRRAMAWIWLLTLPLEAMVKHDARTSVRQAWSPAEARALAERAGVKAEYLEHFGHRFSLVRTK